MAWSIEATDEFQQWFAGLSAAERVSVARKVDLLEEIGPLLGRPDVDTIKGSRFPNMKELRKPYRVFFAFDPRQTGILLIGGRKGPKHWYKTHVAMADAIYANYLQELREEGAI